MNYIRDYFTGMLGAFKQLFTRIGWQGLLLAFVIALWLGVILPLSVQK